MSPTQSFPQVQPPGAATAEQTFERLGLRSADVAALKRSGTITQETRGRNTVIHKLRYRRAGRQVVKYLGVDGDLVRQVREQLAALQAAGRRRRRWKRLAAEIRAALRRVRGEVRPSLQEAGYELHGHTVRRSRSSGGK